MPPELSQRIETLPDVVGIVGSRGVDRQRGRDYGWPLEGYNLVLDLVARIQKVRREAGLKAFIVTGDAPSGVDFQVRLACRNLSLCNADHVASDPLSVDCLNDHYAVFPAYWHGPDGKGKLNRHAGFERNERLVRHCGLLIALLAPDVEFTPGTADAIRRAREWDVPVLWYQNGSWHE